MRRILVPALLAFAMAACDARPDAATDSTAATVRSDSASTDAAMAEVAPAAAIALGLRQHPGNEDSVLAANGTSREDYDAMMYRIAMDPAKRQMFETATGR